MATEPNGDLRIGNALKEARRRAGLDIRTVEERTKIRTRYLRALESEEWEALPGHAYVKGFLRTYARLLGLDGDALVDEYRRTVEGPEASPVPLGEGVLETRRRLREPGMPGGGSRRGLVIGGLVVGVVGILLVLGLTAGEDEGGEGEREGERKQRARAKGAKQGDGGREKPEQRSRPAPETVTLRFVTNTDGLPVCLLDGGGATLIDGVSGSAGSEDSWTRKNFELRFPSGYDVTQFDLFVDGKREKVEERSGPAAFAIRPPAEVRPIELRGSSCP